MNRQDPLGRGVRVFLIALTVVVLGFAAAELVIVWRINAEFGNIGEDFNFFVQLGRRWLESGVLYGDRQLTGAPYHVEINVDNLYPPPAALLFAAFVFLPWIAWYLVPVALVTFTVWRLRPGIWTWPLMALCLLWPRTVGSLVAGNSDLWSAGFVAAGILWGWPSVLTLFKPAFPPVALIGIRRRSWWIALVACAIVSLLFLPYWSQYFTAASNWDLPIARSLPNLPILLIPMIAWVGRRRPTLPYSRPMSNLLTDRV
jgi:hypothetical protein